MSTRRLARLNEQLKREISEILRTAVRDPRVGHPTITGVEVTPDVWMARVYVRADPTQAGGGQELLEGLTAAGPFIRREVGKALEVRRVPELRFQIDETLEHALNIERILREVLPAGGDETSPDEEEIELVKDGDLELEADAERGEPEGPEEEPGSSLR